VSAKQIGQTTLQPLPAEARGPPGVDDCTHSSPASWQAKPIIKDCARQFQNPIMSSSACTTPATPHAHMTNLQHERGGTVLPCALPHANGGTDGVAGAVGVAVRQAHAIKGRL
jgi:hypothetical protein